MKCEKLHDMLQEHYNGGIYPCIDLIDLYYECETHPYCDCKYRELCAFIQYFYPIDFPIPTAIIYAEGEF